MCHGALKKVQINYDSCHETQIKEKDTDLTSLKDKNSKAHKEKTLTADESSSQQVCTVEVWLSGESWRSWCATSPMHNVIGCCVVVGSLMSFSWPHRYNRSLREWNPDEHNLFFAGKRVFKPPWEGAFAISFYFFNFMFSHCPPLYL